MPAKPPMDAERLKKLQADRRSVGFTPGGFEALPREVYKSIFFSTSSAEALNHPARKAGSSIVENCRGVSMQEIHDQSRQKYQRPKAPMVQRSACTYTQEYTSLPLDGADVNQQLFDLFKDKSRGSAQAPGNHVKIGSATEASQQYVKYSKDQARKAPGASYKPKQERHTDPDSKLLVKESMFRKDFAPLGQKEAALARQAPCTPAPMRRSESTPLYMPGSSYEQDYRATQYNAWRTRFAKQSREPPPVHGYSGKRAPKGSNAPLDDRFQYGDVLVHGEI